MLLGLVQIGGKVEENWATLRFGTTELHLFQGYIPENLLHWRGGDIEAISAMAAKAGIVAETPFELHPDGAQTITLRDPAGNGIFLNTFPVERQMFLDGCQYTERELPDWEGSDRERLLLSLAAADPEPMLEWYGKLGLEHSTGMDPGTYVLAQGGTRFLLDSVATENRWILEFGKPQDLTSCLLRLSKAGLEVDNAELRDPDGNLIMLRLASLDVG